MPKDAMGHEFDIGDRVLYLAPRTHRLVWGEIIGYYTKVVVIKGDDYPYSVQRRFNELLLDTTGWQKPSQSHPS